MLKRFSGKAVTEEDEVLLKNLLDRTVTPSFVGNNDRFLQLYQEEYNSVMGKLKKPSVDPLD